MDRFQETSAIVTGGASGIGFALASELATRGASVILADIDSIRVAQAAQKLKETGAHVTTAEIDVRISSDLTELVNQVVRNMGGLTSCSTTLASVSAVISGTYRWLIGNASST